MGICGISFLILIQKFVNILKHMDYQYFIKKLIRFKNTPKLDFHESFLLFFLIRHDLQTLMRLLDLINYF